MYSLIRNANQLIYSLTLYVYDMAWSARELRETPLSIKSFGRKQRVDHPCHREVEYPG